MRAVLAAPKLSLVLPFAPFSISPFIPFTLFFAHLLKHPSHSLFPWLPLQSEKTSWQRNYVLYCPPLVVLHSLSLSLSLSHSHPHLPRWLTLCTQFFYFFLPRDSSFNSGGLIMRREIVSTRWKLTPSLLSPWLPRLPRPFKRRILHATNFENAIWRSFCGTVTSVPFVLASQPILNRNSHWITG